MFPSTPPEPLCRRTRAQAGFTLLEVLVALAVTATVLGAIAALMGANARSARQLEEHTALVATARAVAAGIPPRAVLHLGRLDGELAGYRWRMDVRPFSAPGLNKGALWVPRRILIRVRAPSGSMLMMETLRLARSAAE